MRKFWLIVLTIILFCGIITILRTYPKTTFPESETDYSSANNLKEEIFGVAGWILELDTEGKFLTIKSERDGDTFKGFVDEHTEFKKIELPEDIPQERGSLNILKNDIGLIDLQEGDYIAVTSRRRNIIYNNTIHEIDKVRFIPFVAPPKSPGEEVKECLAIDFYPDSWNPSGNCFIRARYTNTKGTPLAFFLVQVQNKTNNHYEKPSTWYHLDCYGKLYCEFKLLVSFMPGGDCHASGEGACRASAIVIDISDNSAIGYRTYNIIP